MTIRGGCQCGALRYAIALDALTDVANCHCITCRRLSGAPFTTWATVPRESFAWERGVSRVF